MNYRSAALVVCMVAASISFGTQPESKPSAPAPSAEKPAEGKEAPADGKAAPKAEPQKDANRPKEKPKERAKPQTLPKDVVQASNKLAQEATCKTCGGDGLVKGTERVRDKELAPGVRMPQGKEIQMKCSGCNGAKISQSDALPSALKTLIRKLGEVDTKHAEWANQESRIKENISKAACVSLRGWKPIVSQLERAAISKAAKQGEPVAFVGTITDDQGQGAARQITIDIGDEHVVVLSDPRIVDTDTDSTVLVGGLYQSADNKTIQIRSGFAMQGAQEVQADNNDNAQPQEPQRRPRRNRGN